ncbi:transposase [Diaphorobacter ruginosibacter]|uniref:Transposase n=1 Tax=Diaphorobacter ruginosibacter TaxID=1715720 RepID=A0A7G9RVK6_9BURK|nr:transposase [Diaphorobacter ruginosibacter]
MGYSLNHRRALTHFTTDGRLPVDNSWIENQIRPIAGGQQLAVHRKPAREPTCGGGYGL